MSSLSYVKVFKYRCENCGLKNVVKIRVLSIHNAKNVFGIIFQITYFKMWKNIIMSLVRVFVFFFFKWWLHSKIILFNLRREKRKEKKKKKEGQRGELIREKETKKKKEFGLINGLHDFQLIYKTTIKQRYLKTKSRFGWVFKIHVLNTLIWEL